MKRLLLAVIIMVSCQREYFEEITDHPTDTIDYTGIEASKDTALMFEPIVLTVVAEGENLQYKWCKNKGSLVKDSPDGSVVKFWGCPTCTGDVTVQCTVYNEYGSETKGVELFIIDEMYVEP